MLLTRRDFLKSLGVLGAIAMFPALLKPIDWVASLEVRLKPQQRFSSIEMSKRGYKNLLFRGVPVTNERVKGSIWFSDYLAEFKEFVT